MVEEVKLEDLQKEKGKEIKKVPVNYVRVAIYFFFLLGFVLGWWLK